jgi:hypothetical protein
MISPILVVAAARPTGSTPLGGLHRLLATKWWLLPFLLVAPPGGPPLTVTSTSVVTAVGPTGSTPYGGRHQHLQRLSGDRCRSYRQHPLGGLPLTYCAKVVVVDSLLATPLRGPLW